MFVTGTELAVKYPDRYTVDSTYTEIQYTDHRNIHEPLHNTVVWGHMCVISRYLSNQLTIMSHIWSIMA